MIWVTSIFSILKMAAELYAAIHGSPKEKKNDVKEHLFDLMNEIKAGAAEGKKSGDYKALEAALHRRTVK